MLRGHTAWKAAWRSTEDLAAGGSRRFVCYVGYQYNDHIAQVVPSWCGFVDAEAI